MGLSGILSILLGGMGEQLLVAVLKALLAKVNSSTSGLNSVEREAMQMLETALHEATGTTPPSKS